MQNNTQKIFHKQRFPKLWKGPVSPRKREIFFFLISYFEKEVQCIFDFFFFFKSIQEIKFSLLIIYNKPNISQVFLIKLLIYIRQGYEQF